MSLLKMSNARTAKLLRAIVLQRGKALFTKL